MRSFSKWVPLFLAGFMFVTNSSLAQESVSSAPTSSPMSAFGGTVASPMTHACRAWMTADIQSISREMAEHDQLLAEYARRFDELMMNHATGLEMEELLLSSFMPVFIAHKADLVRWNRVLSNVLNRADSDCPILPTAGSSYADTYSALMTMKQWLQIETASLNAYRNNFEIAVAEVFEKEAEDLENRSGHENESGATTSTSTALEEAL